MQGAEGFIEFLTVIHVRVLLNLTCFGAQPCVLHLMLVSLDSLKHAGEAEGMHSPWILMKDHCGELDGGDFHFFVSSLNQSCWQLEKDLSTLSAEV